MATAARSPSGSSGTSMRWPLCKMVRVAIACSSSQRAGRFALLADNRRDTHLLRLLTNVVIHAVGLDTQLPVAVHAGAQRLAVSRLQHGLVGQLLADNLQQARTGRAIQM